MGHGSLRARLLALGLALTTLSACQVATTSVPSASPTRVLALAETSTPDGNLQLVTTGGGNVFHDMRDASGHWQGLRRLNLPSPVSAVTVAAMPAAFSQPNDDGMYLFLVVKGAVYADIRYNNGYWHGIRQLNEPASVSSIAAAGTPDGGVQLLMLVHGSVYYDYGSSNGDWRGAKKLDEPTTVTQLAVAGMPDVSLHVVLLGGDGVVYDQTLSADGAWTTAIPLASPSLSGVPQASPSVSASGTGPHNATTPLAKPLGSAPVTEIALAGLPDGHLHLVMVAGGVVFDDIRAPDGTWQGPRRVPQPVFQTVPHVAITGLPNKHVHLTMIDGPGAWYDLGTPAGAWTGPSR
jgi:hypothetical protein